MAEVSGEPPANRGAIPKTTPFAPEPLDAVANTEALARRGYELCHACNHRDGIEFFTPAISLNPNDHRYCANRSYAYSLLGEHDRDLEDANAAVALDFLQDKCHWCAAWPCWAWSATSRPRKRWRARPSWTRATRMRGSTRESLASAKSRTWGSPGTKQSGPGEVRRRRSSC
ncbi:hypothetical protein HPB48_004450 [Haemaphysalis longicornis]|uniref:Tetratricopeptide repeat protein n=1 Tax=Haemaphysalis longicornis TaxID=44386 RepID=A0A9J6FSG0_HAELO|nr:hypothetical protein HPB48_004450 [Haemaphysalis longicornis]